MISYATMQKPAVFVGCHDHVIVEVDSWVDGPLLFYSTHQL